jgi:O-acetyl-ADP-ribose deacetylase (regulator of RNase III)
MCLIRWLEESKGKSAIIQQNNCHMVQGGGIALRIKEKFPMVYKEDIKFGRKGDITKLGEFFVSEVLLNKFCYGYFGQFRYGTEKRHTNYEAMYNGLENIKNDLNNKNIPVVAIPNKMGCSLGGGDFRIVRQIIEVVFENSNLDVYICNYDPDKKVAIIDATPVNNYFDTN